MRSAVASQGSHRRCPMHRTGASCRSGFSDPGLQHPAAPAYAMRVLPLAPPPGGATMTAMGQEHRGGLVGGADETAFLRRLLALGSEDEVAPLLDHALALIVESTGARIGYLELHHDDVRGA